MYARRSQGEQSLKLESVPVSNILLNLREYLMYDLRADEWQKMMYIHPLTESW
jgi:hypothetical protein